jgi:hypothetical protein
VRVYTTGIIQATSWCVSKLSRNTLCASSQSALNRTVGLATLQSFIHSFSPPCQVLNLGNINPSTQHDSHWPYCLPESKHRDSVPTPCQAFMPHYPYLKDIKHPLEETKSCEPLGAQDTGLPPLGECWDLLIAQITHMTKARNCI